MEFNSINFNIHNISNQKAGLVQNNQEQNQALTKENLPQAQSSIQYQKTIEPEIFNFQLIKMDNETVLKYLQNLMQLPNSIDKFVNQLNSKNIDPKIASILVENMINTKALSEFLNKNSSEAISKLMQTISLALKSGNKDISQLKEVLSVLGSIQTSTSTNANSIKELLLLYIPLNSPVFNKNADNKIENEEEKEAIKNSKLSILFETINFSNLLVTINEDQNALFVDLFAPFDFKKDEFMRIFEALSKEANIISNVEFKTKQKTDIKNEIQNFKIISDGFISPNALILAHIIIKTVLKTDEDFI